MVITLPEELRPIYAGFGIDLPAHNGDDTFELPIPATFVIGKDGAIALAFADADYTQRAEPDAIIAALDKLAR
ncbi:MAG: alkyl hydroperoxide reductase [Cyanophyceae cyanobacterium]